MKTWPLPLLLMAALCGPLPAQDPSGAPAVTRVPVVWHYVNALHRQDRDMGPEPFTQILARMPARRRSPVWSYVSPLHPRDREMGPMPYTDISFPPTLMAGMK